MIKAIAVTAAALVCNFVFAASAAPLPGKPDPENGRTLARSLCVNCHQVEPGASERILADVPTFSEIAAWPDITPQKLQGFMIEPHPAMPTVQLTRDELADLAAYILTLGSRSSPSGEKQ